MILLSLPSQISDNDIEVDAGRHFEMSNGYVRDKWVPVTTAWRVLRLQMEELPPTWRVAANILSMQSVTAD
jgi:very-short-patch-repair endonuclease